MAKLSTDELLDAFKEMTLIELSEFVKQFEETFGVTAAAPVAVAAAPAAGGGAVATRPPPSRTSSTSSSRPRATRRSRSSRRCATLTSLGLKEAKDLVDGAPKPVLEKVNKEAAEKAKAALEAPAPASPSSSTPAPARPRARTSPQGRSGLVADRPWRVLRACGARHRCREPRHLPDALRAGRR